MHTIYRYVYCTYMAVIRMRRTCSCRTHEGSSAETQRGCLKVQSEGTVLLAGFNVGRFSGAKCGARHDDRRFMAGERAMANDNWRPATSFGRGGQAMVVFGMSSWLFLLFFFFPPPPLPIRDFEYAGVVQRYKRAGRAWRWGDKEAIRAVGWLVRFLNYRM
ncbi:hypothetical protein LY76DRAFT_130825 [Colletotrichum caudatum]|nr:hypothetical protein LY76DRAFT_130825 [Colletotrichum caudatum]